MALVSGDETLNCNGSVGQPCSAASLARILDLVGYGNANFFEGSGAAPALDTTLAALRAGNGAQDTDNNAADFAAATPNPRNSVVGDAAPSVTRAAPPPVQRGSRAHRTSRSPSASPVNVAETWYTIECNASGSHRPRHRAADDVLARPDDRLRRERDLHGDSPRRRVTDQDAQDPPDQMAADPTFTFQTVDQAVCGDPATQIGGIQGSRRDAAITGNVTVQGVVVGDFEGRRRGGCRASTSRTRPATATTRRRTASSSSPATRTTA